MKPATFAPAYVALYPKLASLAIEHGYALAIHGSVQRDFDLICVPWTESPSSPSDVVSAIVNGIDVQEVGAPAVKLHGRISYTIAIHHFGVSTTWIDLSFMPRSPSSGGET